MSYTVTEATVVFPDKKAVSSFSSGYASKKPCAHIDCELEGGFERSIWIPVRVARLYVKNRPDLPCDWDNFCEAVQLIERKCALTMVTEMLSRRDHATGEVRDKLARYGFHQPAIDFAVERATEYRFLDESRFCSYFIEERKRRGWDSARLRPSSSAVMSCSMTFPVIPRNILPSKTIWRVRQPCSPSGVFQRRAHSKNWFGF
ncbi:MAG: regulatory protein RecX [Collinsella sp.]